MKINEIKRGMSGISTEGEIIEKAESRNVNTRYGPRSVANAKLEDDTGSITISLWEEKIDLVNVGDRVEINGAYITEFRNELQLNIPRAGKLEIISKKASGGDMVQL